MASVRVSPTLYPMRVLTVGQIKKCCFKVMFYYDEVVTWATQFSPRTPWGPGALGGFSGGVKIIFHQVKKIR